MTGLLLAILYSLHSRLSPCRCNVIFIVCFFKSLALIVTFSYNKLLKYKHTVEIIALTAYSVTAQLRDTAVYISKRLYIHHGETEHFELQHLRCKTPVSCRSGRSVVQYSRDVKRKSCRFNESVGVAKSGEFGSILWV